MYRTDETSLWPEEWEKEYLQEFDEALCFYRYQEADTYDPDEAFYDRVGPHPFALIVPTEL